MMIYKSECKFIPKIKCILGCKYPKSRRFFLKTRRQVERLSDVVFKAVIKIAVQFLMLPKCLVSYGVYFMTDSGSDSFELPVPMW